MVMELKPSIICAALFLALVSGCKQNLFLAEADYDGRCGFLVDDLNKPQRFNSVEQVKLALDRCTIYNAYLVHQSAYDEMCGGAEKVDNTLKVPLVL